MTKIFIPFDKELYDDLVRFSDGGLDVSEFASEQIMDYLERNLGDATSRLFGARSIDFYRKYFPEYAKEAEARWKEAEELSLIELLDKPLVWKEITVPPGTKVRMQYGGTHHFATVRDGKIEDDSGRYSPSRWARKVANNTSRNAWRDIEFMELGSSVWVPAQLLRNKSKISMPGRKEHAQD